MLTSCARVNVFGERCKAAKQGFWLRFNHSWDPRVVPIRNFQTVSLGSSVNRGIGAAHWPTSMGKHLVASPRRVCYVAYHDNPDATRTARKTQASLRDSPPSS